jgi:hypothetical protein
MNEPTELSISRWLVRELPNGDRHIIGLAWGEGRVSSKIVSFDKNTMTFTTATGRKYHARKGGSAINITAAYVWETWCYINKVTESKDVTDEYDPEEENE